MRNILTDRDITNRINWVLDNLVPPILRDNDWFMGMLFRPLFGEKSQMFMRFKSDSPYMTHKLYSKYYKDTADVHLHRETDLNQESVEEILARTKGPKVLDVGAGRGYLAMKIFEKHPKFEVVGLDLYVPPYLKKMEQPSFVVGNVEELPFPDKSFDTVIATHTLEHVMHPRQLIAEMRRVARKRIIVVTPRQREYQYTFDLHLNFFPYPYSLLRVMAPGKGRLQLQKNDWYYEEDLK